MGRGERRRWRVWVDTGGTFTDAVAVSPDGEVLREKVLSSSTLRCRVRSVNGRRLAVTGLPAGLPVDFFAGWRLSPLPADLGAARPELAIAGSTTAGELSLDAEPAAEPQPRTALELRSPDEAPVVAARLLTRTPADQPLPPLAMRLATTRGTNALLERRGGDTALFVTRGFADLLTIGEQRRPELFRLAIDKPAPFYSRVVEVDERLAADGSVLCALDREALAAGAGEALAAGCEAAAVAFLHSYLQPEPEREAGKVLRAAGFRHVSLSAELAPLIKILPRAHTAVVDAYLSSVLEGYLDRVAASLGEGSTLHVMTSAGGLVERAEYRAKDSLLSGPAGGVIGAGSAGRRSDLEPVIAFDMGGTSTDVSRYEGGPEYVFEQRVGDAVLASPGLAIETVAAGGGSVCGFDGAAFTVGPQSAGADPGPACYGAGGPLTVTDVNLLLGRIDPERFGLPLAPEAAKAALSALVRRAESETGESLQREAVLAGLLRIADERMAEAIRRISVRRGYAPSEHALVAFGGAGGQHAVAVAELLGIDRVMIPQDAGLLSALGLGSAAIERFAHRQVLCPLADAAGELEGWVDALAEEARAAVLAELSGGPPQAAEAIRIQRALAELRWQGQESVLEVEMTAGGPEAAGALAGQVDASFRGLYRERYGYLPEGRGVELVSLRLMAAYGGPAGEPIDGEPRVPVAPPEPASTGQRRVWLAGRWREVACYDRAALPPGSTLVGPVLVFEAHSAAVVPPGWQLAVTAEADLLASRAATGGEP